ncbi:MAG: Hsp20 family protein [Alphaproteobacteria bacterium]|nr:Hsp20 family protein [Alphaproteobacteria bacterium]NCQ88587.1 Hsp20 family protein [Alphaproteobacteria bacterium]NCT06130.1 Hsp20 family protein [Alphaproteobacteria bacterium]
MTTRLSLFDSPMFLGFDHFEETFNRLRKNASEGYPPYNIEQTHENGLRITLAVAGFTMDDLDVEVEKNQLIIRGRNKEEDEHRLFIHRGIAARQFQRSFVLADGIEVLGASMDNGLLHIDMRRIEPETTARKIKINQSPNSKTLKAIDVDKSKKNDV